MPKIAAQEFADLFKLTPQQAVEYLQGRDQLTRTYSWQDLWHEEHTQQFTVSRMARMDILKAMQDGITASVQGDMTRRDWMRDMKALLKKEGWWGEIPVIDEFTGKAVNTKFDSARLKLIFDTNVRQAYAAGQWQRIADNKEARPYIRYVTRRDGRVRDQHRRWDNLVLPVDDPFWQTRFPPNAYRCRCHATSISQAEYDKGYSEYRAGYEYNPDGTIKRIPGVERIPFNKVAPPDDLQTFVNQRTGEVSEVPAGVMPGFDFNPGMARAERLRQVAAEKIAAAPRPLATAAVADGMNIARAVDGQPNWNTLGYPDLRAMAERTESAPKMLPGAADKVAAVDTMRRALGIEPGGSAVVTTPIEQVSIDDLSLPHVVQKRDDQRERFAGFVLPTLLRPTEVWAVKYDDGSTRNRYIKLFSGSKYDLMVVVMVAPDGSLFWNMMQRDRKGMNSLRIGELVYDGR